MAAALLAGVALLSGAGTASAQSLRPPVGAELVVEVQRRHDRYDLPTGPLDRAGGLLGLEGRVGWWAHVIDDDRASTASVLAHYRAALDRAGYETLLDCRDEACGGVDFRFHAALMPAPEMLLDSADFGQLSARRLGALPDYVSVLASRVLGRVHIQTVRVTPTTGAAPRGTVRGAGPEADAGAGAAPQSGARTDPAASPSPAPERENGAAPTAPGTLIQRLLRDGHAAVRGVDFATGGATLTPQSQPAIRDLAQALLAEPALEIIIVGHSDNAGALEPNLALSRRRARAVREALIAEGVAPDRVAADGVGFLAPVTANSTEAGRARNRRVEIVLR